MTHAGADPLAPNMMDDIVAPLAAFYPLHVIGITRSAQQADAERDPATEASRVSGRWLSVGRLGLEHGQESIVVSLFVLGRRPVFQGAVEPVVVVPVDHSAVAYSA